MTEPEEESFNNMDFMGFLEQLRRNASVKAGAVIFGEAQTAYYDVLKTHMSDEDAFNMTAHTTECLFRGVAEAAGPVAEAVLRTAAIFERVSASQPQTDKEVPGGGT